MAPRFAVNRRSDTVNGSWRAFASDEDLVLESWSQGCLVGSLLIMGCVTVANMRKGVLLHKLILLEQLAALSHGTFCFFTFPGYGWYLSSTAALLYCSWVVHNIVAWLKIGPLVCDSRSMFKPQIGKWIRRIYLGSLVCTIPPIILQIYNNFRFFNNINDLYVTVRPYEPLMRDPWWVFSVLTLFEVIRKCYGTGVLELIKRSPRFAILLSAITLSLIFTVLDIVASIHSFIGSTDGINPWWKLSLMFKCLTDTIMLDDFKTELKRLGMKRIRRDEMRRQSVAIATDSLQSKNGDGHMEFSDALNYSPTQSRTGQALDDGPTGSQMGRLRQDSVTDTSHHARDQVGKLGMKISRLPGLKDLALRSAKTKAEANSQDEERATGDDRDGTALSAPERLSQMRQSLGIVDYHPS
ncbi:hypothetical protein A1O1_08382 [Capronia coronata CBS 617.96]|uniref:Uncharacterized protein n=1 Tax=Capronia coronata CBS 617.96 TaxID=1182541 RepID=W9XSB7_9EURO|nr:uncharacterized protein A1O1_08382 [Capronia coronata CBS 617.96]EXJ80240.1 hypothetical protein A1O1_08382 [Capronia coronata CBS 617.96]